MKKRLLSLLAAAVLLLAFLFPFPGPVLAAPASGVDGEIYWEISGNRLTISAVEGSEGRMNAYSLFTNSPWQNSPKMKEVETVVIEDGVTSLGAYAFHAGDIRLKKLSIPGSVRIIPNSFCHSVTVDTLYIGEGVGSVEKGAFYGVTSTVYVAKSVENIPLAAFGVNNAQANGTISYVRQIYGYTDSVAQKYANDYIAAIAASNTGIRMWKDGKTYALDSNLDGIADANPKIVFTALDKSSVLKKATVTSSVSVSVGKTQKLKVTVPSYLTLVTKYSGTEGEVKATYKSKNSKIATVDKNGKVTGKKKGTTTITTTLKLKNGTKKTFSTKVTVK